jgi:hypothetical protein
VFIHEIGHALAFNGWRGTTTALDGIVSPWDQNVSFEAGVLGFHGAHATALYGGPVPVTVGYDFHIGNLVGPGSDLQSDVMNGVGIVDGVRYDVSALDLAMLQDMGLAVSPAPEPATVTLMLAGLAGLAGLRRRQHARS